MMDDTIIIIMLEAASCTLSVKNNKPLLAGIAAGLLLVGNAVGHLMRTSDDPRIQEFVRSAEMFESFAGANVFADLNSTVINHPHPAPLDTLIGKGGNALREFIRG